MCDAVLCTYGSHCFDVMTFTPVALAAPSSSRFVADFILTLDS